ARVLVAVEAAGVPLVLFRPLDGQDDDHTQQGQLSSGPGDAAGEVLFGGDVEPGKIEGPIEVRRHRRGRHHQGDAEERVDGHGGDDIAEPADVRQFDRQFVDADDQREEHVADDDEVYF